MEKRLLSLEQLCAWLVCLSSAANLLAAPGPIQTMIDIASPGTTVFVPAGVHSANLYISKNIVLQGAGTNATVLDGGGNGRVITIGPNVNVTIQHMSIQKGNDYDGGGIHNTGNTVLNSLVLRNNIGDRDGLGSYGGGIYNVGTLLVTNTVISSNLAFRGGGIYSAPGSSMTLWRSSFLGNIVTGDGGGIDNSGTATMEFCHLQGNLAYSEQGVGSAIYNGLSMMLNHCAIVGNGQTFYGNGGAIWNDGSLRLQNSQVSSNSALYYAGIENTGSLVATNSSIIGNSALYDTGGLNNEGEAQVFHAHIDLNSGTFGAGVYNYGTLQIESSSIDQNLHYANDDGCRGGGVYNDGLMNISNSSICNNYMKDGRSRDCVGSGIFNRDQLTLENCTISGNFIEVIRSSSFGGGICNSNGVVSLTSCTIAYNTAQKGGGIASSGTNITLRNTILANNLVELGIGPDCYGALISSNFNLIGSTKDCLVISPKANDRLNVNPGLGPLGFAGGPTMVHPLLNGSPAIDSGNPQLSAKTDQRGFLRKEDGDDNCTAIPDIGAYERSDPYRPIITSLQRLSPTSLRIHAQAKPNARCVLQSIPDLSSNSWQTEGDLQTDANGMCIFDAVPTAPARFFRLLKDCSAN